MQTRRQLSTSSTALQEQQQKERAGQVEDEQPQEEQKQEHEPPQRSNLSSTLARAFGVFVVSGSVLFSVYMYQKAKADASVVKAVKSVGAPAIGGSFTMTSESGELMTESDFGNAHRLLYFGFTYCPDICPTELTKMSEAIEVLDARGADAFGGHSVVPVFISVDPWRDSIAQVREYIAEFHPRMVGLTGTPDQVQRMCRAFRIYYSKPPPRVRDGEIDDEFYLMDHSAYMYLLDPSNKCIDYFSQAEPADHIAERIAAHLDQAKGSSSWLS
jgi:protein SCO1